MDQAEALIAYYFGLVQEEIDSLSDEVFVDLAAKAYFYEERRALAVKRGLLMALKDVVSEK